MASVASKGWAEHAGLLRLRPPSCLTLYQLSALMLVLRQEMRAMAVISLKLAKAFDAQLAVVGICWTNTGSVIVNSGWEETNTTIRCHSLNRVSIFITTNTIEIVLRLVSSSFVRIRSICYNHLPF